MIKQETIDQVRNKIDIYEVLGKFIVIKKNMACCPFHNEATPSFHIWKNKQLYKCFGCGKSGDAIRFVMEHERKNFNEAIEWLAAEYNIPVEYEAGTAETEEKRNEREEQLQVVAFAQKKYEDLLNQLPEDAAVKQYLHSRGITANRMKEWSMGFTPDQWKFITTPAINMGKHTPALGCGLIYTRDGNSWDAYRNRLTLPIHDHNGMLVGIASRMIPTGDKEADKKTAKWMNPAESLIYSKKKIWYGLFQAMRALKETGFAYVVEGYFDVQTMHNADVCNTVASSGTEIDDAHVKLLKRYTDHVVILYDGDKAGLKKSMKQINLFLRYEFKVSVIELPDNLDPDEFILNHQNQIHEKELHPGAGLPG